MSALAKAQITFESHIYAYGPHGFSTADSSVQVKQKGLCNRAGEWVEDSIGFLRDIFGDFTRGGMTEPNCSRYTTHDYELYLSADCTFNCLLNHPEAKKIIEPLFVHAPQGINMEAVGGMSMRTMLSFVGYPKDKIEELNDKLQKIKNII